MTEYFAEIDECVQDHRTGATVCVIVKRPHRLMPGPEALSCFGKWKIKPLTGTSSEEETVATGAFRYFGEKPYRRLQVFIEGEWRPK